MVSEVSVPSDLQPPRAPLKRGRKFVVTPEIVDAMAELGAKCMTEPEACALLGIAYQTWANWKWLAKNNEKYSEALTRVRAKFIQGRLATIERAETKDWRAADRLLQIAAPERFGQQRQDHNVNVQVSGDKTLLDSLRKVYELSHSPAKQLADSKAVDVEIVPPAK